MLVSSRNTKRYSRRIAALPLFLLSALTATRAYGQAGVTKKALPNVLLLVDTSGSMERMFDGTMPGTVAGTACSPGVASTPNRWGALVQALTGNVQPFYSCDAISRTNNNAFKNEYKINGSMPYDDGYYLPYHRPLSGSGVANACALAPYGLSGVGAAANWGNGRMGAGGDAADFPADAFKEIRYANLRAAYAGGGNIPLVDTCTFEQARDGQLDAARDYVRFSLMTFDSELDGGIGVTASSPPGGSVSGSPFLGTWSYRAGRGAPFPAGTGAEGRPENCLTNEIWEVGARHNAAPPWEGRMVPFPSGNATLADITRNNEHVQQVLLGSRPYGPTPIDGLLFDAKDYLTSTSHPFGPMSSTNGDPYVKQQCRDQFIVLLTDGAPNLSMLPGCDSNVDADPLNSRCPFDKRGLRIAKDLYDATPNITTYVIGFSVNGESTATDGFPAALVDRTCRGYLNMAGINGSSLNLKNYCATPGTKPAAGTTAAACCELNDIAYAGSGGLSGAPSPRGAFFVESQADLVLAFGTIMGGITRDASTRTVPTYSPVVNFTSATTGKIRSGEFVATFIPSAQRIWSGEIDRTRSYCVGAATTPQSQSTTEGDSYGFNLASQAGQNQRLIFTAKASSGGVFDSAGTMRPYKTSSTYDDQLGDNLVATEVAEKPGGTLLSTTSDWWKVLGVDSRTCKRSRVTKNQTVEIFPALTTESQCADVIWGFATSRAGAISYATKDFNFRCSSAATGGDATSGTCSITNQACTLGGAACPTGEVCVPRCSALGAIFRSNPVVIGPPEGLIRDDGYRDFSQRHASRRPTMLVSTTDGVLHAFKALATPDITDSDTYYEMWGFVPPAVLPNLAANYPTGQQILLDGTPVVKDVVWSRLPGADSSYLQWKTTLVAGLGFGGGGYYALNLTDVDCGGLGKQPCRQSFTPATSNFDDVSKDEKGPHFMWQLTDVKCAGGCGAGDDPAKRTRRAPDGTQRVALFGSQTGTPAITQVQVELGEGLRQYGVAILPGGIDGSPVTGGACQRGVASGLFAAATYEAHDTTVGRRAYVRQWGPTCASPVAGRSLTVVRLDTGEIIRHFARVGEAPATLTSAGIVVNSPFDSPVTGTPVVFPNVLGAPAQKAYVGDADGTIWRLDLSSKNPSNWKVELFHDMAYLGDQGAPGAARSQPISIPLVLSVDNAGEPLVNAATGDQENLVHAPGLDNWVASIGDKAGRGKVNWSLELTDGERVTGPMSVFDRTLYYASFRPNPPQLGQCSKPGEPYLWGVDYATAKSGNISLGGDDRWCKLTGSGNSNVDAASGTCAGAKDQKEAVGASMGYTLIPGVTVRQSLACATQDTSGDPAFTGMAATEYALSFGRSDARTGQAASAVPQSARTSVRIPRPRTPARLDSWAYVID